MKQTKNLPPSKKTPNLNKIWYFSNVLLELVAKDTVSFFFLA